MNYLCENHKQSYEACRNSRFKVSFTISISSFLLMLLLFCSLSALAQTELTFATVTECVNYGGDKLSVKKITISGNISGTDYSKNSEWSQFYYLHDLYPALESIEILTDQDIPASDVAGYYADKIYSLFYRHSRGSEISNLWLKSFSAPNVKTIGKDAFYFCGGLKTVYFPSATKIGSWAFHICYSLSDISPEMFPNVVKIDSFAFGRCKMTSVHFPKAEIVEAYAFKRCTELTTINFPKIRQINFSAFHMTLPIQQTAEGNVIPLVLNVSLGTELETPTQIMHDSLKCTSYEGVFDAGGANFQRKQVALTLGINVLPKPDQEDVWPPNEYGCHWGSIAIVEPDGIEEVIAKTTIAPNPTNANTFLTLELEMDCDMHVSLCNALGDEVMEIYNGRTDAGVFVKTLDTRNLPAGVYFVKVLIDDRYIVEKLVVSKSAK